MKLSRLILKIVLINSFFCQYSLAKISIGSIKSYFFNNPYEKNVQKKIPIKNNAILNIKNMNGNISIKEWNLNTIQMKATTQTDKEEQLDMILVKSKKTNNKVSIETIYKNEKINGKVNYEFIVPNNIKINVSTINGSIDISKISIPIKAKTETGNITISETKNLVIASTSYGSINIENSSGNIQAITENGNISIEKTSKNLIAKTKKGTIYTTCSKIDSLDKISLATEYGNIIISLPKRTNATIKAETKKGKLTCEHFVTLKPQTLQLNKKTWNKMRKKINGTIGNGNATIKLSTGSGNIKILETT